jgi:hypothetical protein
MYKMLRVKMRNLIENEPASCLYTKEKPGLEKPGVHPCYEIETLV